MRTNVVGRHIDITEAIRLHAEQKALKLDKYADLVQQIDFTVGQESSAKELFWVEVLVAVRGHAEIVAKNEGHDLYLLIDDVVGKADRQLHDFKEKIKLENR